MLSAIMLSGAIAPLLVPQSVQAQLFRNSGSPSNRNGSGYRWDNDSSGYRYDTVAIAVGTDIPVMYPDAEKILVAKDETMDLTLRVAANLKDNRGNTLIPYDTEIRGRLEPVDGGSQFVAEELIFPNGNRQDISGSSDVIYRTETIEKGADTGDILEGAAIGAGAALIISLITGDQKVDVMEVLIGGGLGAAGGWILGGSSAEVISIYPDELDVRLDERLDLSPYN